MIKLPDKVYNILKWLVLIVIPALTTFYVTLDKLFGWNYAEYVAPISAALCTLVGAIIGISSVSYYQTQSNNDEDDQDFIEEIDD